MDQSGYRGILRAPWVCVTLDNNSAITGCFRRLLIHQQGDKTFCLRVDVVKKGKPAYIIKALQQKYPTLQSLTVIDDIGLSNTLVEVDKLLVCCLCNRYSSLVHVRLTDEWVDV
jgi:hypothetical protein